MKAVREVAVNYFPDSAHIEFGVFYYDFLFEYEYIIIERVNWQASREIKGMSTFRNISELRYSSNEIVVPFSL